MDAVLQPGSPRGRCAVSGATWLKPAVLLVAGAGLVRLPFLWHGFGIHPDEAGVLRSGIEMWLDGRFYISRPPGYPLNELLMGALALVGGGPLCALAAATASVVAVAVFGQWLRVCGVRHAAWIALALAVHPWFWRSSTHTLDYIWAMLTLVLSGHAIETGRYRRGALWCALGLGFRWSSILWVGAFAFRAYQKHRSRREGLLFIGIVGVVGTVVLAPALLGTRHWAGEGGQYTFLAPTLRRAVLFGYHLVEFWGHVLGVGVIAAAWWFGRLQPRAGVHSRPDWLWVHVAIVGAYVGLFWLHSDKCEYFLPALPSGLFLLGRTISRRGWQVIALAFLVNGMVTLRLGHWPRSGIDFSWPHLEAGAVLMDYHHRADTTQRVSALWQQLQEPKAAVVVPGLRVMEELNVFARLKRGPTRQLIIDGRVIPGMYHQACDAGAPRVEFWPVRRTGDEKTRWPILLNPDTGSVAIDGMCPVPPDDVAETVREAYLLDSPPLPSEGMGRTVVGYPMPAPHAWGARADAPKIE